MKTLLLFSGGYDSTFELNYLMKTQSSVDILIIESDFSGGKVKRENEARKRIIDYLKAKYYECTLNVHTLKLGTSELGMMNRNGLTQPLFWLPSALMVSDPDEETRLIMTYIAGDQALANRVDIENIVKSVSNFRPTELTVEFPLMYTEKSDLLSELIKTDKFLFENATTCESWKDESDHCGECLPCKHFISAMITIIIDPNKSDEIKSYCRKYLKDKYSIEVNINKEEERKVSDDEIVDTSFEAIKKLQIRSNT